MSLWFNIIIRILRGGSEFTRSPSRVFDLGGYPPRQYTILIRFRRGVPGYFPLTVRSSKFVAASALVHRPTLPASLNVSSLASPTFLPSK